MSKVKKALNTVTIQNCKKITV